MHHLTIEEVEILMRAMNRLVSRLDAEVRYATTGAGHNNPVSTKERLDQATLLRDRLRTARGVIILGDVAE